MKNKKIKAMAVILSAGMALGMNGKSYKISGVWDEETN